MKTQHYTIMRGFAKANDLPISFVAAELRSTARAVYLYGHGEIDPHGRCIVCGRTLTHPGSILLGIGPECLGSWETRDIVLDNVTEADREYLRSLAHSKQIDCWMPKSVIKEQSDWDEETIEPPSDHKMLNGKKSAPEVPRAATLTTMQSGKDAIKITFPFDRVDLSRVKSLPGRRFHGDLNPKCWTAPLSLEAVRGLKEWGFALDAALEEWLQKMTTRVEDLDTVEIPGAQMPLYPFQQLGVAFIEAKNGRALVADEMGLGKTLQALAWLQLHPEKRPAVIVVPASLKLNWAREIGRYMSAGQNVQIISGTDTSVPLTGDIIIINYDILPNKFTVTRTPDGKKQTVEHERTGWVDFLVDLKLQVLITDECHYFKNNEAARTKGIKKLGKSVPHIIALSGTPIVNRPAEGFNAINLINEAVAPSFWKFAHRYCAAKHNGFGWDFSGASNTEELHTVLTDTIMIRRLKTDVLRDLPDKTRSFIPIELEDRRAYEEEEAALAAWIREARKSGDRNNAEALVRIETLKQVAASLKLQAAIGWIRDFIETDGKLVVFANHKFVIERLMEEFKDLAVKIDGSVSQKARDEAVQRFQNDEGIRLFVGNIQAAGVGITLTAASSAAFLELPWTPGELTQAEDRCHRIGQENAVNIYYLLAEGTIEEDIATLLDKKRRVLDDVLDGKDTDPESLITQLMNKYKED